MTIPHKTGRGVATLLLLAAIASQAAGCCCGTTYRPREAERPASLSPDDAGHARRDAPPRFYAHDGKTRARLVQVLVEDEAVIGTVDAVFPDRALNPFDLSFVPRRNVHLYLEPGSAPAWTEGDRVRIPRKDIGTVRRMRYSFLGDGTKLAVGALFVLFGIAMAGVMGSSLGSL